jgi:hypothetical protein
LQLHAVLSPGKLLKHLDGRPPLIRYLRLACYFFCCLILLSNVWTISGWNESRGVYDDICYLRQAHLFQRFGVGGLDTDIARDDDHYLSSKLKAIGFSDWNDPARAPCHSLMEATQKRVMTPPPGTGFSLALFPAGFQVIPLYLLANVTIFGFAVFGVSRARGLGLLTLAAFFGYTAIYLMINPAKASYSMAPTMIVCALAGYLTARLFSDETRPRLLLTILTGFLVGMSVNFRLPNLLLSSGYCLYFLVAFLIVRSRETFLRGLWFGIAFVAGMAPTLIAQWINAGSPFTTTYGGVDVAPPEFNADVLMQYVKDMQFGLFVIACLWTGLIWRFGRWSGARPVALVVAGNLALNLIFFMTHPIFTPYYIIPIDMLSLWTLLFATLGSRGERAANNTALLQPAKA